MAWNYLWGRSGCGGMKKQEEFARTKEELDKIGRLKKEFEVKKLLEVVRGWMRFDNQ